MPIKTWNEFVDYKVRDVFKKLKIVGALLQKGHFKVEDFIHEDEDPYIFVHTPKKYDLSFGGIRIYSIGEGLAYRVQNEKDTHPYGESYNLDIEAMWNDLLSEYGDEEKCGKKIISALYSEILHFFKHSADAEQKLPAGDVQSGDIRPIEINNI